MFEHNMVIAGSEIAQPVRLIGTNALKYVGCAAIRMRDGADMPIHAGTIEKCRVVGVLRWEGGADVNGIIFSAVYLLAYALVVGILSPLGLFNPFLWIFAGASVLFFAMAAFVLHSRRRIYLIDLYFYNGKTNRIRVGKRYNERIKIAMQSRYEGAEE